MLRARKEKEKNKEEREEEMKIKELIEYLETFKDQNKDVCIWAGDELCDVLEIADNNGHAQLKADYKGDNEKER